MWDAKLLKLQSEMWGASSAYHEALGIYIEHNLSPRHVAAVRETGAAYYAALDAVRAHLMAGAVPDEEEISRVQKLMGLLMTELQRLPPPISN